MRRPTRKLRARPAALAKKTRPAPAPERSVSPVPDASTQLSYAREVLEAEAAAILSVRDRLGKSFTAVLEQTLACKGQVVVTGMGKPGFIAQKLSATLASTGTPSLYLHPAE